MPGIPNSRSQLAVPIVTCGEAIGVLYVESPEDSRFGYDDEDALVAVAAQLGTSIQVLYATEEESTAPAVAARAVPAAGTPVVIRHYRENDSVFLGDDYLIKGVAGAIFWKLVRDYVNDRRTEFTNRELRLDPAIRLPDVGDNLEARLVLLQRRLGERCRFLRIEKTGRGRFRLEVDQPVQLLDVQG
jgi:adenylate cyclase